jgi:hypothetical protein
LPWPPTRARGGEAAAIAIGGTILLDAMFGGPISGASMNPMHSLGPEPGNAPHPQVVEALREVGIDASDRVPRKLDQEAMDWADVAVPTCSEEVCPVTPRRSSDQLGVFEERPLLPLRLLGLALLLQRLLGRLLLHALLRVLVLVRHVLTSLWARVAPQLRRGSAGRIVALPSSSTSTT